MSKTTCARCNGPATMIDAAPPGESGDVVRCNRNCREVDDGIEVDVEVTLKVTRYIPREDRGRMYMTTAGGEWSDKKRKLHGRVDMAGMDTICAVSDSKRKANEEQFTFKATDVIEACIAAFRNGAGS